MESVAQSLLDILLLFALIGFIVLVFVHNGTQRTKRLIIAGIVVVFVLLVASLSAVIVPAGNVGVVTAFGKVQDDTLTPGIHFRLPIVNNVHLIDTRVQPHEFKEIDAASAEYQSVKLTGIMNYHIDGAYASDLYQRVGDDFAPKVIDPAFNDYIKSVVPNYGISTILGKRDEIRQQAKLDLQANLSQYHIIVDDIYIANIGFSPEYEAAIEAKQVAQQQVETERQITQQRIQQAQQAIEKSKGDAQAQVELATGQSKANDLLTKSLSPELIQYTLIQKLGPDIKVMLLPSGQQFILDPKVLTENATP